MLRIFAIRRFHVSEWFWDPKPGAHERVEEWIVSPRLDVEVAEKDEVRLLRPPAASAVDSIPPEQVVT